MCGAYQLFGSSIYTITASVVNTWSWNNGMQNIRSMCFVYVSVFVLDCFLPCESAGLVTLVLPIIWDVQEFLVHVPWCQETGA